MPKAIKRKRQPYNKRQVAKKSIKRKAIWKPVLLFLRSLTKKFLPIRKPAKKRKKAVRKKKHPLLQKYPLLNKVIPQTKKGQAIAVSILLLLLVFSFFILRDLPSPTKLKSRSFPVSTLIYDRHGTLLYEIFADTNRTPISLTDLPPHVHQATIAIEDQDFYHHFGFSFQGIVRALRNIVFKNKLQGGSTITQQLVKTTLLSPERTLQRKLREAVLTLAVEILYSKDYILEMYLNHIPYGGTAYGIESAARRFFDKNSSQLTLPETTLLAGLPQAPTRYSPFTNPEQAKARQHEVLRRMVEDNYITQKEADQAFQEELNFAPPATDIKAPHFVFYIKSILENRYGLQAVEQGGLRVTTTLDLNLQQYTQASLSAEINRLEKFKVTNGAALVTKPDTGEILSMVGSRDFFNDDIDGKVNITTQLRQPGSSIKPINYVTAFQNKILNPASLLLDIPTCFQVTGQPIYCPKNYDGTFHGPVQVRFTLANSYNIPAVKTLALNSIESMIATASAMGITSFTDPSRYGLSLTLGGGEVTMIDMATAFGTLANQGVRINLHPILKVENYTGKVLEEYHPPDTQSALEFFFDENNPQSNELNFSHQGLSRVLNREPAYLISHILLDNNARAAAFGTNSELNIRNKTVSVKTGTTNDLRDNWTIGYTPQHLVATWVGNNDNTPMNQYVVSGVTGAAPIFNTIMTYLLKDVTNTTPDSPPGIKGTNVCLTGSIPTLENPCSARYEFYWDENPPTNQGSLKKGIWVFKDTQLPAFHSINLNDEPVNTDNLELKEHLVVSDLFTQDFCLDCPWHQDTDESGQPTGKINYPPVNINMDNFLPFSSKEIKPFINPIN